MDRIIIESLYVKIGRREILKNICLDLKAGEIYGFYGRNASGKTMLFRAISGLINSYKGSINVFGEVIGKDVSFPSSIGLIIENVGMWNPLTGFENLKLLAGIKKIIDDNDIRNALIRVGLDPDDKRKYKAYSLGMKQKLAIAQAIMEKPKLIILDEPTNSLDEESVNHFRKILLEEKARGATCLIASHHKEDIKLLCDQIFIMKDGFCTIKEGENNI